VIGTTTTVADCPCRGGRAIVEWRGRFSPVTFLSESLVPIMYIAIIVTGIAVVGAALGALAFRYRGETSSDLGSVSHTWIAELRAGDPYDSSR
jgi:hypothetical protein